MASKNFHLFKMTADTVNNTRNPGVYSNESRIQEVQQDRMETLVRQIETLCAADRRRIDAVLERLGRSAQQDPLPAPQPPVGPRERPVSSVARRRIRALPNLPPRYEGPSNGWTSTTQRHQTHQDETEDVDTHTPSDLRSIPLITTPVEVSPPHTPVAPPPPAAPRPRRRVPGLPVMWMHHSEEKKVIGGYRLQTAKGQVEEIQKGLEKLGKNSVVNIPRPPVGPKPKRNGAVTTVTPAPPPRPVPPKNTETRCGTIQKPAKTVKAGKKRDDTLNLQTADRTLAQLQPLSKPEEALSSCFNLLSSKDWEKKIDGLKIVQALAQNHPDILMVKLHEVCLAVIEEVKNLRSAVTCAAMDTMAYLYVYLGEDMDTQVERTGRALLLRIAQANANVFLQQQASKALEALVENCNPGRILTTLLNTGLSHLFAAVRASTAHLLHLLVNRLGVDAVLGAGKNFTQRFLIAVSKMSMDSSAEVRPHGHAILQALSLHRDFSDLWRNIISDKDRRPLERILRTAQRV
uniref:crescerin-like protein che-12 n=1 Tax=Scatophagus argus TaxID=75038 RepID=UPI001ED80E60|nr:crescerin-like protein che-12 [Scatophagus argus]